MIRVWSVRNVFDDLAIGSLNIQKILVDFGCTAGEIRRPDFAAKLPIFRLPLSADFGSGANVHKKIAIGVEFEPPFNTICKLDFKNVASDAIANRGR